MSSWQYLLKLIFAGPCTNSCPGANICGSCAQSHPTKVKWSHGCHGCPSGIGTCRCVPWPSSAGPWSAALIGHPPPASNRKPQQLGIARASANWTDFWNNLGNPWKSTLVVLTMQSLFGVSNSYCTSTYIYIVVRNDDDDDDDDDDDEQQASLPPSGWTNTPVGELSREISNI